MKYEDWTSYKTYQIDENFSLEKADAELLGFYCEIHNQKLTAMKNIHYLPTLTNTYLNEVKSSYQHFTDLTFWIVKNGNRIGGILVYPNSLQSFFMLETYNNLEELSSVIFNLLLKISDLNNPIKTLLLNQEQTAIFKRLGYVTDDLYCNMLRPTEKFEITWESEYVVISPERKYLEELKKFHIAIFPELSEDILIGDADAYIKSYEADELLKQAAVLVFNKNNELIANSMVWKFGDMPVIMATGVKEEYRNHGLATKMLKHALTVLHGHYPAIRLEVNFGSAAHRLYQNLGFISGSKVEELSYYNKFIE